MKEKKNLVKVIVYALLLLAMLGIGFGVKLIDVQELKKVFTFDGTTLVKLLIMIVSILLLENLLLFVLQLVKPKKHRTGSVLSLICSLIKYAAFIAVICFGLTILGVNITTIIASIGILALIVGFSAESLIADIVTGTFMLLENQYNVGEGHRGGQRLPRRGNEHRHPHYLHYGQRRQCKNHQQFRDEKHPEPFGQFFQVRV